MTIDREQLQIILSWIRGENVFNNKPNKWDWLLIKSGYSDTDFIEIPQDDFENILIDALPLVIKVETINNNMYMLDNSILKNLNVGEEQINKEIEKMSSFVDIINNLIISNELNNNELKSKKLDILNNMMKDYIRDEEYEKCILLSDKIKNLENYFSKA